MRVTKFGKLRQEERLIYIKSYISSHYEHATLYIENLIIVTVYERVRVHIHTTLSICIRDSLLALTIRIKFFEIKE